MRSKHTLKATAFHLFFVYFFILIFYDLSFCEKPVYCCCTSSQVQKEYDRIGILLSFSIIASTFQSRGDSFTRRGHNVAAVLINDQSKEIIEYGLNRNFEINSPIEHAEIRLILKAINRLNNGDYSELFYNCTLYTSLEPCPMCAGAMVMAGIPRVVYGQKDPNAKNIVQYLFKNFGHGLSVPFQIDYPLVKQIDWMYSEFLKNGNTGITKFLELPEVNSEIFGKAKERLLDMNVKCIQNEKLFKKAKKFLSYFP